MRYLYILILFSLFLPACELISDAEYEARLKNAFDISGSYRSTDDSEVYFDFKIINKDNKNDISVEIHSIADTSVRSFTEAINTSASDNPVKQSKLKPSLSKIAKEYNLQEESFIDKALVAMVSEKTKSGALSNLFVVGKNWSKDFGETSEFSSSCSNRKEIKIKSKSAELAVKSISFYYCISGNVKKENKNLISKGLLILRFRDEEENKKEDRKSSHSIEFKFSANKITK